MFEARPGVRLPLAISAGAAVFPHDGDSYESLLAKADSRMYRDKSQRKNDPARQLGDGTTSSWRPQWPPASQRRHTSRPQLSRPDAVAGTPLKTLHCESSAPDYRSHCRRQPGDAAIATAVAFSSAIMRSRSGPARRSWQRRTVTMSAGRTQSRARQNARARPGRIELLVALERRERARLSPVRCEDGRAHRRRRTARAVHVPRASPPQRVLFVAGGTGIAPLRAMLDHALRRDQAPLISLLYSARRSDEFAFIDELRGHARGGRIELHQTVTRDESAAWEGGRGRIGRAHFQSALHEPRRQRCVSCADRRCSSRNQSRR